MTTSIKLISNTPLRIATTAYRLSMLARQLDNAERLAPVTYASHGALFQAMQDQADSIATMLRDFNGQLLLRLTMPPAPSDSPASPTDES